MYNGTICTWAIVNCYVRKCTNLSVQGKVGSSVNKSDTWKLTICKKVHWMWPLEWRQTPGHLLTADKQTRKIRNVINKTMQNFLPLNKDQLLTFKLCCCELELKCFRAEGHQNIQFRLSESWLDYFIIVYLSFTEPSLCPSVTQSLCPAPDPMLTGDTRALLSAIWVTVDLSSYRLLIGHWPTSWTLIGQ